MRRRRLWLDYLVYLAVRTFVAAVQRLSVERSYALADRLAALLHRVDKRHRIVGLKNLEAAFGDAYDDAGRAALVRDVYRHFCRMLMEILHIPKMLSPLTWRRHIVLKGHEAVLDRLITGGPLVMISGHFGNWEMAGYLFGVFGFSPCSVARTLDNPYLDRYLRTFREGTGQRMIPKKGGYDDMLEVLREGRVLSFLADQDAGARGMFVDFFGRPASTHKAIALLAIQHQAPIAVGYARRIGPGFRYEVGCVDLIDPRDFPGGADDVRLMTQRYTKALEQIVRESPEQYLWLHRRWKHQPPIRAPKRAASSDAEPASA